MRAIGALLMILAASAPLAGTASPESIVSEKGEVRFTARYEGQPLDGVFRRFRVEMPVEPATGEPGGLRVVIATGSADMNDADVNQELRTTIFFDADRFPDAVFTSDTISRAPDGTYSAAGAIEVKGATYPLSVPFRLRDTGGARELTGEVSVSRLAWRIGLGEWAQTDLIADEVVVRFRVEFTGASP
ncbi:MAG: YceI family protein [Xanthomonadales bacterium]